MVKHFVGVLLLSMGPFLFGDKVKILRGKYAGGTGVIIEQPDDKKLCKDFRYLVSITRKGAMTSDYLCHEDLEFLQ